MIASRYTGNLHHLCGRDPVVPNVPEHELRGLYAKARVALVPLRFGAGIKLKMVEALREGVPAVSTPVGAQGLPLVERQPFYESQRNAAIWRPISV